MTEAIITSYKLGSQVDSTKHALQLREGAIQAYKQSDQQSWPPTPEDFECSIEQIIPVALVRHPDTLITGQS